MIDEGNLVGIMCGVSYIIGHVLGARSERKYRERMDRGIWDREKLIKNIAKEIKKKDGDDND